MISSPYGEWFDPATTAPHGTPRAWFTVPTASAWFASSKYVVTFSAPRLPAFGCSTDRTRPSTV
ncbi:hypothetical protein ISCU110981_03860 [Isoptericola cucumis]